MLLLYSTKVLWAYAKCLVSTAGLFFICATISDVILLLDDIGLYFGLEVKTVIVLRRSQQTRSLIFSRNSENCPKCQIAELSLVSHMNKKPN